MHHGGRKQASGVIANTRSVIAAPLRASARYNKHDALSDASMIIATMLREDPTIRRSRRDENEKEVRERANETNERQANGRAGRTDGWTDGRTNERTDERTDERTNK